MNTVTLRIRDLILDDLFQHDFYEKTISQLRWNVLPGAFQYGVLSIIDYLIIPNLRGSLVYPQLCFVLMLVGNRLSENVEL